MAYEDCRRQIEPYRDAGKIEAANRTIREREDMLIAQNARGRSCSAEARGRNYSEGVKKGKHPDAEHGPISERMENMTKSLDVIKTGLPVWTTIG
ncbi:MAG: hypothetical protein ACLRTA_03670 [Clostridia bacterium]